MPHRVPAQGHPLLEEHLDIVQRRTQQRRLKRQNTDSSDGSCAKQPKWHMAHLHDFLKQRLSSSTGPPPTVAQPSPWVALLTDREREVLECLTAQRKMLGVDNHVGQVVDLSQSLERQNIVRGTACPCVTPSAKLWHIARERPVLGVQRLALQGLQFPQSKLASVPNDLLPEAKPGIVEMCTYAGDVSRLFRDSYGCC